MNVEELKTKTINMRTGALKMKRDRDYWRPGSASTKSQLNWNVQKLLSISKLSKCSFTEEIRLHLANGNEPQRSLFVYVTTAHVIVLCVHAVRFMMPFWRVYKCLKIILIFLQ